MSLKSKLSFGIARKSRAFCVILVSLALLSSCQEQNQIFRPDTIDPAKNLTRDDYKNTLTPKTPKQEKKAESSQSPQIPDLSQIIMPPPQVAKGKLITISVTEDVPLKDVLIEIARKSDLDLELDPGIEGGIIFRAKDRSFNEVIERISDLAGLKYSINNGVLKVGVDSPYMVNYTVDFLNQKRIHKGFIRVETGYGEDSASSGTGSSGSGSSSSGAGASSGSGSAPTNDLKSGSKSQVDSEYDGDIWKSVDDGIKAIIDNYRTSNPGLKAAAPTIPAAGQVGNAQQLQNQVQRAFYTINKPAGIITVMANERLQKEIKRYIDNIKTSQSSQVLIEAKVVEVTLNEDFKSGIQWGLISQSGVRSNIASNFNNLTTAAGAAAAGELASITVLPQELFGSQDATIDGVLSFTEKFGISRTLSSPRINAVNNQQAILTFAKNTVYFTVDLTEETRLGSGSTQDVRTNRVTSRLNTVPVGVILTLQPSINLTTNEITMNIRPTLSRITSRVEDPATKIIAQRQGLGTDQVQNLVPEVEIRELDSVLKIKSGQVMVIGGLMEERTINNDSGIPGVRKIPIAGNLFGNRNNNTQTVETVIFIKATIVPGQGVSAADRKIYETFTNDPRPLFNN